VEPDPFIVLAEPMRRRILDELRQSQRSVGELVARLNVAQPVVSKHLRILRDAGFVTCSASAQMRIYRIEPAPLRDVDAWVARYRRLWVDHLDALEQHLDEQEPQ
jgi:DNA-binding transcriptional ArsR family regulator